MPSENTEQRKLAAILFTDMVGYSALSQRNEALGLAVVSWLAQRTYLVNQVGLDRHPVN